MPKVVFNVSYTAKNPPKSMASVDAAQYMARRSFYDMTAAYNYFTYTLRNEKVVKNKDILNYMEKNSGVFNTKEVLTEEQKKNIQKKLQTTDSHIWHGVISFDQDAGKGFITQDKAMKFLNQTLNAFFERTHLNKNNIELIASLHNDTDNNHIHFAFFEKEPKRRDSNGKLCYTGKGTFSARALENYLVAANMHMSEYSYDYYSARDRAMARLKELRKKPQDAKYDIKEIRQRINGLSEKLPKSGRLQYNAENMATFRKEIDEIGRFLVSSDSEASAADKQILSAISAKEKEARTTLGGNDLLYMNSLTAKDQDLKKLLIEGRSEYLKSKGIDWANIDYFDKLRQDYQSRIGNQVIGLVLSIRKDFRKKESRAVFNDKQRKLRSRSARRNSNDILINFMKALGGHQRGVQTDFSFRLHQIEYELQQKQYSHGGHN